MWETARRYSTFLPPVDILLLLDPDWHHNPLQRATLVWMHGDFEGLAVIHPRTCMFKMYIQKIIAPTGLPEIIDILREMSFPRAVADGRITLEPVLLGLKGWAAVDDTFRLNSSGLSFLPARSYTGLSPYDFDVFVKPFVIRWMEDNCDSPAGEGA